MRCLGEESGSDRVGIGSGPWIVEEKRRRVRALTSEIFNALKGITGPATLIAYLAALGAWSYVVPSLAKIKAIGRDIGLLPEKDRLKALRLVYPPVPDNVTAEQWLDEKRMRLQVVAFIATLAAMVMTIIWLIGK